MDHNLDVEIMQGIPADYHPQSLKGNSHATNSARIGLTAIYSGMGEILVADKQTKDKAALFPVAVTVAEHAVRNADSALSTVNGSIKSLQAKVDAALALPPAAQVYANELRAIFRAKKSGLTAAISEMRNGSPEAVQAILAAPAILSGLTREQQSELRKVAEVNLAGEHLDELNEAMNAKARLERAMEFVTKQMVENRRKWVPDHGPIEQLKKRTVRT